MLLNGEGLDIFYIDESVRTPLYVATAVRVPFIRPYKAGYQFVWQDYQDKADKWRRWLSKKHSIRFREELHAYKIVKPEGLYHKTGRNLTHAEAFALMADAFDGMKYVLPGGSILTAYATDASSFAGNKGMSACLLGLFQRMRSQCRAEQVKGMVFFDEGHDEYVAEYRKAKKYLPTGSAMGGWDGGNITKNMPLDMFLKDANIKKSHLSLFMQMADLVAYCARIKLEHEAETLATKRVQRNHHKLYDLIPSEAINLKATNKRKDGLAAI